MIELPEALAHLAAETKKAASAARMIPLDLARKLVARLESETAEAISRRSAQSSGS